MQQIAVLDRAVAPAATSDLVVRGRLGDQPAWDQFVERYGGMVWAVARAMALVLPTRPTSARSPGCS